MRSICLFILLAIAPCLRAQHYTYISDRRFFEPADMIGYDFKPAGLEIPNGEKRNLDAGEYSFGISQNYLYVSGEGIEGVYNINNMQPVEYGFKILLMNARNARLQGHLKVIQNKYGMVEMLIFKRSSNDKEIIFSLPAIPRSLQKREHDYFTDRGETIVEEKDSIWGTTIRPFLILHTDENIQQRLQMADSTAIIFTKKITIEEKEVKKKKKKNKEKDKQTADQPIATSPEEGSGDMPPGPLPAADSTALPNDTTVMEAPKVKVKITKEYFLTIRSNVLTDGGAREMKSQTFEIKKINIREDRSAGPQEERYQWELLTDKKIPVFLYLNGDHTVSTLEIGSKKYLMRGF